MFSKINSTTLALILIVLMPGIGYFIEGSITISSCVSSLIAFFLVVAELVFRNGKVDVLE